MAKLTVVKSKTERKQITQHDLLYEIILRRNVRRAVGKWRAYRKELFERMLAGEAVEEGVFEAERTFEVHY